MAVTFKQEINYWMNEVGSKAPHIMNVNRYLRTQFLYSADKKLNKHCTINDSLKSQDHDQFHESICSGIEHCC